MLHNVYNVEEAEIAALVTFTRPAGISRILRSSLAAMFFS